jgi:hypothetical protein
MARIYLSVGSKLNDAQEAFVKSLEARIKAAGMTTHTLGRSEFSSDAPLIAVKALMDTCDGAIVLALERLRFTEGLERPESADEKPLGPTSLPTAWNQIEATLAYERRLPLLVIVDEKVRQDGMLEAKYDWYVETINTVVEQLDSLEFVARMRHFGEKVQEKYRMRSVFPSDNKEADVALKTIGEWIKILTPAQFWAIITSLGAAFAAAFGIGLWVGGLK